MKDFPHCDVANPSQPDKFTEKHAAYEFQWDSWGVSGLRERPLGGSKELRRISGRERPVFAGLPPGLNVRWPTGSRGWSAGGRRWPPVAAGRRVVADSPAVVAACPSWQSLVVAGLRSVPLSVLDLCPVPTGESTGEALRRSVDLARHAERWGFTRYWVAEHHNMPGIASSAPAVLVGQIASATSAIRVGSGGVMLPNHAPLTVAEQFGMLEALHPGRIDLGIGRAPGTDRATARALRRTTEGLPAVDFARQLAELRGYFAGQPAVPQPAVPRAAGDSGAARIRAIPAEGNEPAVWLLGSTGYSAELRRPARLAVRLRVPHQCRQRPACPRPVPPGLQAFRDARGAVLPHQRGGALRARHRGGALAARIVAAVHAAPSRRAPRDAAEPGRGRRASLLGSRANGDRGGNRVACRR